MESKPKYKIPEYDPQTGERNPYYEELTGKKEKVVVEPETDLEKFDRFLIMVANTEKVGIRRKILMVKKFIEAMREKED